MPTDLEPGDPAKLDQETKESIEKVRDLLGEMKIVQEHENAILDDEPSRG